MTGNERINEDILFESAFESKQFDIIVERGEFRPPYDMHKDPPTYFPTFDLLMTFSKSPYPPREAWKPELTDMVESVRQFQMTGFCANKLPVDSSIGRRGGCILM